MALLAEPQCVVDPISVFLMDREELAPSGWLGLQLCRPPFHESS